MNHESRHVKSNPGASHKKTADCKKRKNLGIGNYTEKVIDETPIGKGLKQMGTDYKKALVITLHTTLSRMKDPSAIILNFKNSRRKTE